MVNSSPRDTNSIESRRSFRWLLTSVFILALALRLFFVGDADFGNAIHGDAVQYVSYAYNLADKGVFSMARPDAMVAVPDSFRGPGYPLVLAVLIKVSGKSLAWLHWALCLQALLGSITVVLVAVWAKRLIPAVSAICCGLLVALWPHLVTTTAYLVTETLTGFMIMLSLVLSDRALRVPSRLRVFVMGCAWGFAYLVNPICLLLPFLLLPWFWQRGGMRLCAGLMVVFLALPVVWTVRNATLPSGSSASHRALGNFVEGSWPEYHDAYNSRNSAVEPALIMKAIGREEELIQSSRIEGLRSMWSRMSREPIHYVLWYAAYKPYLLWDWSIRIGNGDIYLYRTAHSPFERPGVLRIIKRIAQLINPVLFFFALAYVAYMLVLFKRDGASERTFIPAVTSTVFVYLTLVHVSLQAEPRYSIAYRPIEFVLAIAALVTLLRYIDTRWMRRNGASIVPTYPKGK